MAAKAVVRDVGRVLDLPLHLLRPAREADPVPAGQATSRSQTAREMEPQLAGARAERGGGARAARARRAARGPDAQRRHARGRRADRAGQAHRLLPALRAARARTRWCRSSTRTTSRRSAWSSSTSSASRRSRSSTGRCATSQRLDPGLDARRSTTLPLDDTAHLPASSQTANTTAVFQFESRGMRDLLKRAQARPLRGHHRAGRALPAGADGPDPRLHRAQARARSASTTSTRASSRSSGRPTASWCTRSR